MTRPFRPEPARLMNRDFLEGAYSIERTVVTKHYPLHWHEFFELELIVAGVGVHNLNGHRYALRPGCFYLLTPTDLHEVTPSEEAPLELINLKLSDGLLDAELRKAIYESASPRSVHLDGVDYNHTLRELERLEQELCENQLFRAMAVQTTIIRMLIDFLRKTSSDPAQSPAGLPKQQEAVHSALAYLHLHFREPITLGTMARLVHMSESYFSECFSRVAGEPFKGYLQKLRLQFAGSLLSGSPLSVTEICYASGFNSVSHFVRSFSHFYGVSPNQFRKNAKESE